MRQNVMCNADTSVITYEWFEGVELPVPYMQNTRVCRDWQRVETWAAQHKYGDSIGDVKKPMYVEGRPRLKIPSPTFSR